MEWRHPMWHSRAIYNHYFLVLIFCVINNDETPLNKRWHVGHVPFNECALKNPTSFYVSWSGWYLEIKFKKSKSIWQPCSNQLFSYYGSWHVQIFALWAVSPKITGGLSFTTTDVGNILAISGMQSGISLLMLGTCTQIHLINELSCSLYIDSLKVKYIHVEMEIIWKKIRIVSIRGFCCFCCCDLAGMGCLLFQLLAFPPIAKYLGPILTTRWSAVIHHQPSWEIFGMIWFVRVA